MSRGTAPILQATSLTVRNCCGMRVPPAPPLTVINGTGPMTNSRRRPLAAGRSSLADLGVMPSEVARRRVREASILQHLGPDR